MRDFRTPLCWLFLSLERQEKYIFLPFFRLVFGLGLGVSVCWWSTWPAGGRREKRDGKKGERRHAVVVCFSASLRCLAEKTSCQSETKDERVCVCVSVCERESVPEHHHHHHQICL